VPNFNLWTLWWNADRLTHAYSGYWDAPTFAPLTGTFAFSEPQFLTGLLAGPMWLATGNRVLAYNLIVLMFLTLNGAAAYVLMRSLSVDVMPAVLSALIVEALPFVTQELGVLQLVPLFGILLTLHFAHRFSGTGAVRDAVGMGTGFAVTFHMTGQYSLLLSLMLLALSPFAVRRELFHWRPIAALLLGTAIGIVLIAPIAIRQAYVIEAYDLRRSLATIAKNSAELGDYLRLPRATLGYRTWNSALVPGSGQRLSPGTGVLSLGLWGLVAGLRRQERRLWVSLCATGAMVAFALSFGPTIDAGDLGLPAWQPYESLRAFYPGLQQLRSPFRFSVFVQIFLALLAGLGLDALHRNWRWRGRTYVVIGLTVLTLAEIFPAPIRLTEVPTQHEEDWITWLACQPEGTIVAHVPFPESGRTADLEQTTEWMLYQTWHGQQVVNGYSGFSPTSYRLLAREMRDFPDQDSLEALQQRNVAYVLIEKEWLAGEDEEVLADWEDCLVPILESTSLVVFELTGAPGCP
jgi:hypothetical protein